MCVESNLRDWCQELMKTPSGLSYRECMYCDLKLSIVWVILLHINLKLGDNGMLGMINLSGYPIWGGEHGLGI